MGDQDQGRSGLKEQNKPLSLNKKSREVFLERQASARESQIAELRSDFGAAVQKYKKQGVKAAKQECRHNTSFMRR